MLLLKSPSRLLTLVLATLFLANCGGSKANYDTDTNAPPADLSIDPELKPLLDSYVADAAKAGVAIPDEKLREFQGLMWTDTVNTRLASDATILGVCQRRPGLRYVEILRPNEQGKVGTTSMDAITLKIMVYHELGHCLHDFSGHTDGKSAAIMNAWLQPARFFDPDGLIADHFKMLKKIQDGAAH